MSRTMFAAISTTILRAKAEVKERKTEENNQQFDNECIGCGRMLWQSNESKICFQQNIELEKAIDELWNLMQISKESYNIMKKVIYYEDDWKVKNREGRDNGALQHKVWNPGRLQLKNDEDNVAYGQQ